MLTMMSSSHFSTVNKSVITTGQGCIVWGLRIIIPPVYQHQALQELHQSHPDILRMKSLARLHVQWPNIENGIEKLVRECVACNQNRDHPQTAPLHLWEYPRSVWQRLHLDFAGPFFGRMWFSVLDARSKWPEVMTMETTTSIKTIQTLRTIFARWRLTEKIVSDNGPQFTSTEFQKFCRVNGVKHILVVPYHPSSNVKRNVLSSLSSMPSRQTKKRINLSGWSSFSSLT